MIREEELSKLELAGIMSPQKMVAELDRFIIGQARAKRAVAVALWKQQLRAKGLDAPPNAGLLLYGPTGCGKTALVREAARLAELPFLSFDATTLSEAGYRGRDAGDIIDDLLNHAKDELEASTGVVFLDEVDKLAGRGDEYHAQHQRGTQSTLLKLIEGMEVQSINTEDILFIFGGAFPELTQKKDPKQIIGFGHTEQEPAKEELTPKDFVEYGMEAELMGRIGRCVPLNALNEEDLRRILLESELSAYRKYQTFFQKQGRTFDLDAQLVDELVKEALNRGMGARGLNALVEEHMEPLMFELGGQP
ncbi:MAG: AAA family ATPase [Butyricicoccus sp.]|nr:AAA family ATPase [Butyricicoccus sp.]